MAKQTDKKKQGKPLSDERRAEIRAQVVAYVREAKNYTRAAKRLSEEGVPTLSGAKKPWPPISVREVVIKDDPKLAKTLVRKPAAPKADKPKAEKATAKPKATKPESAAVTPNAVVVREGKTEQPEEAAA